MKEQAIKFIEWVVNPDGEWIGDIDGGDVQDMLHSLGILEEKPATKEDAEHWGIDEGDSLFYLSDKWKSWKASPQPKE